MDSTDYKQFVWGTWNTTYSSWSIQATFNSDMTSDVVVLGLINTGEYSIDGSEMTMSILGKTVSGAITKVSNDEFTITSGSTVLRFTK